MIEKAFGPTVSTLPYKSSSSCRKRAMRRTLPTTPACTSASNAPPASTSGGSGSEELLTQPHNIGQKRVL